MNKKTNKSVTTEHRTQDSGLRTQKKRGNLAKKIKLVAMVFWVGVSGMSWGQLVIDASNSPAEWSDQPTNTLTFAETLIIQSDGVIVKNGGSLRILHSTSQTILKSIFVNAGGDVEIDAPLSVNEELEIFGNCTLRSNLFIKGLTSITGLQVLIGSNANLYLASGAYLRILSNIPEFIIEQNANVFFNYGHLESNCPNNLIYGEITVNSGFLDLNYATTFGGSGKLTSSNNAYISCNNELVFTNSFEFDCEKTNINFGNSVLVGSLNKLKMTNSCSLQMNSGLNNVIIRGEVIIDGSFSNLLASRVDLYGKINIYNSTFCLLRDLDMFQFAQLITQNSTLEFGQDAIINMKSTCDNRIVATNTVFKPMNVGGTWKGINATYDAPCNTIISQYTQAPQIGADGNCSDIDWAGILNTNANLINLNGCAFEKANTGVEIVGQIVGVGTTSKGAAIIRARNTTFTNCQTGIRIKDYANSNGDPNASYIMTCDFITNDDYPFLKQELTHIVLHNLGKSGVNIGGCIFTNSMSTQEQDLDRGVGIKVFKASVSVAHDGDRCKDVEGNECADNSFEDPLQSRPNKFHNLSYGVQVDQGSKTDYSASTRFSDFYDCYRSFDIKNSENTPINENNFTLTQSNYASYFTNANPADRYFINLQECGGYTIAECVMTASLDAQTDEMTYILSTNATGLPVYNSKINMNTFTNNATGIANGIVLQDHSRGNDITCNTFINLTTDIWVKGNSSASHLEFIPKRNTESSWNTYSKMPSFGGNSNWVTNIHSDVSIEVIYEDPNVEPEFIGPVSKNELSGLKNCGFICGDNENTTTASDETLGVKILSKNANLWIYEQGANAIAIGANENNVFDVCIYNLYGQCSVQLEKVHSKTSIDVSGLASGIYFVSLRDSEGVENILKFIKK